MMPVLPSGQENFSIGEASRLAGVAPSVLRYWESVVGLVRPIRRGSGHRRFSRHDMALILRVKEMTKDRGMTLEGVKKQLRREAREGPVQVPLAFGEVAAAVALLKGVRLDIEGLLKDLKKTY